MRRRQRWGNIPQVLRRSPARQCRQVATRKTLSGGNRGGVKSVAAYIVRTCYRGQWESLVFEKGSKRFYVEEEAPAEGEFIWLSRAQTQKVVTQFMECAHYSLMTLRIYGREAQFRALQEHLRVQPLHARDIWTACRIRDHEQLDVTRDEIRALLDGQHLPVPDVAMPQPSRLYNAGGVKSPRSGKQR